jgi:hypothetical protein
VRRDRVRRARGDAGEPGAAGQSSGCNSDADEACGGTELGAQWAMRVNPVRRDRIRRAMGDAGEPGAAGQGSAWERPDA